MGQGMFSAVTPDKCATAYIRVLHILNHIVAPKHALDQGIRSSCLTGGEASNFFSSVRLPGT